jgi:hypothetical protein
MCNDYGGVQLLHIMSKDLGFVFLGCTLVGSVEAAMPRSQH